MAKLAQMNVPVSAIAVSAQHTHALIRVGESDAVRIFGRAKQFASHQLRSVITGPLWAASSHVVRMRTSSSLRQTRAYILEHASAGAWVWSRATN